MTGRARFRVSPQVQCGGLLSFRDPNRNKSTSSWKQTESLVPPTLGKRVQYLSVSKQQPNQNKKEVNSNTHKQVALFLILTQVPFPHSPSQQTGGGRGALVAASKKRKEMKQEQRPLITAATAQLWCRSGNSGNSGGRAKETEVAAKERGLTTGRWRKEVGS